MPEHFPEATTVPTRVAPRSADFVTCERGRT